MDRYAEVTRKTGETDIVVKLDLDGSGVCDISTGVPFFDHMLNAFGRHGLFDLTVHAVGDVEVDAHHTVEDTGIVLGEAFCQALGDKAGITRFADAAIAMDETLVMAAVDISGRGQAYCELPVPSAWAASIPSWPSSSSTLLRATPSSRCTCASWRAATRITLSRPPLRPWAARCAAPVSWTLACRAFPAPRVHCNLPKRDRVILAGFICGNAVSCSG